MPLTNACPGDFPKVFFFCFAVWILGFRSFVALKAFEFWAFVGFCFVAFVTLFSRLLGFWLLLLLASWLFAFGGFLAACGNKE